MIVTCISVLLLSINSCKVGVTAISEVSVDTVIQASDSESALLASKNSKVKLDPVRQLLYVGALNVKTSSKAVKAWYGVVHVVSTPIQEQPIEMIFAKVSGVFASSVQTTMSVPGQYPSISTNCCIEVACQASSGSSTDNGASKVLDPIETLIEPPEPALLVKSTTLVTSLKLLNLMAMLAFDCWPGLDSVQ